MHFSFGLDGLRNLPRGAVLSIGNFDGLHLGHQRILDHVRMLADSMGPETARAVVTFEPHPLTVLRPEHLPPRLMPAEAKNAMLGELGITHLIELAPEPAVLNLSAEDFWAILRDQTRPSHIVEGESFTFGKARGGNIELLRQWATGTGIELHIVPPARTVLLDMQQNIVSSSLIRWLLACGRARDAAICLGRPYELRGPVIRGHQRGKSIGVPTANLSCERQMVPADGVYVGRCRLDDKTYPVALSIGTMPTFGRNRRQIEAHLLGFDGDLYGRELGVELIDWVREQMRFPSIELLKQRMASDISFVKSRSTLDAARPVAAQLVAPATSAS